MQTPRMIAIDMDGTLVHPGGSVSDVNRAALRQAREGGARIVFACASALVAIAALLRTWASAYLVSEIVQVALDDGCRAFLGHDSSSACSPGLRRLYAAIR